MSGTLIDSDVDFTADGKQAGHLRLPHSQHRSAYGFLLVPVVSVKGGDDPVVLLVAGNHGDEYEGQVALSRLARELAPGEVAGQVRAR